MYKLNWDIKEKGTETKSERIMNQDALLRILGMVTDEVKRNGKNAIYTKIMIIKED